MAARRNVGLAMVAVVGLVGCTGPSAIHSSFAESTCIANPDERIANVNWLEAETVDLRIRQGEYTPMVIRLRQDGAYVMRIANGDDRGRTFRANEFFAAIALAKVTVGDTEGKGGCIAAVTIPKGETAELQFVAVRDGRYHFADSPLLIGPYVIGAGAGVISINNLARPR